MNSRSTCVQRKKNYNIVCMSGPNKRSEQDFYYFANIKNGWVICVSSSDEKQAVQMRTSVLFR